MGSKTVESTKIFYADPSTPEGVLLTGREMAERGLQQLIENGSRSGMISLHQNHLSHYATGVFDGQRILPLVPDTEILEDEEAYKKQTAMPGTIQNVVLYGPTFHQHIARFQRSGQYMLITDPEQDPTGMQEQITAFLKRKGRALPSQKDFVFAHLNTEFLTEAVLRTIKANVQLALDTEGERGVDPRIGGYVRPLLFRSNKYLKGTRTLDYGVFALRHNWALTIAFVEWGKYLPERNEVMLYPTAVETEGRRFKVTWNYGQGGRAKNLAMLNGYTEAILHDAAGNVLEGTGENIFVRGRDGKLRTPPTSLAILPGTKRGVVLEMAVRVGISIAEDPFSLEALMEAEAAFFTGTAAGVARIHRAENPFANSTDPQHRFCQGVKEEQDFNPEDQEVATLEREYRYLVYGDRRLDDRLVSLREELVPKLPLDQIVLGA